MDLIKLALQVLSLDTSASEVKNCLASLSEEERKALESEALSDARGERIERMNTLRALGFSAVEVYEYSRYKLSSPEVKEVVARRALLAKRLGADAEFLRSLQFYELLKLEAAHGVDSLTLPEMLQELHG